MYPEDPHHLPLSKEGNQQKNSARIRLEPRPNNVKQVKSALFPAQYENISRKNSRLIKLSGKLSTYPSPMQTLTLTYYLGKILG